MGTPACSAHASRACARRGGLPQRSHWATTEPLDVRGGTTAARVRRAGCSGHRGLESRRVMQRNGLRVVSPEDTWCDLAALGELNLDELIVLGDAVVHYQHGIPSSHLAESVSRRRGGRGRRPMP